MGRIVDEEVCEYMHDCAKRYLAAQEVPVKKSIFNKSVDVSWISFQELQYLLLVVNEYADREPDFGKVQDKMLEKLSKLEREWLGV